MNKPLCAMVGVACLAAIGCSKKVAVKTPPPAQVQQAKAAPPARPVISLFAASPGTIDQGGEAHDRMDCSFYFCHTVTFQIVNIDLEVIPAAPVKVERHAAGFPVSPHLENCPYLY